VRLSAVGVSDATKQFQDFGTQGSAAISKVQGAASRFFADTPAGSAKLIQLGQALDTMTGSTVKSTSAFSLNRIGMLELQSAGINAFQALASGMAPWRVAQTEGAKAMGGLIQGGFSFSSLLSAMLTPTGLLTAGVAALTAGFGLYELTIGKATSAADAHKATEDALKETLGNTAKGADDLAEKYSKLSGAMKAVEAVDILAAQRKISDELAAVRREADQTAQDLRGKLLTALAFQGGAGEGLAPALQPFETEFQNLSAALDRFTSSGDVAG